MSKSYPFTLHEGGTQTNGILDEEYKSPDLKLTLEEIDAVKVLNVNQSCTLRDGYLVVKRIE